ncbi:MAG: translocation/assembly module TamB domain-containing protein, partial [Bdellovibrionota bacterium]
MIFRRKKTTDTSKARRRNGMRLALIGMLLGIVLGAGKVFIEKSVEDLLFTLLNDEAKKACECSFDADEVHFSLFLMRGIAKNAKILEDDTARITAPQITADFNLFSHLSKKRIALTSLKLFSPTVNSVHPNSGGVLFISSLAKPLTPEQKEEFKIRIKLLSLEVINGTFVEPLPMGSIVGEGVSLRFFRDEKDNLQLTPTARNLLFRREHAKDFSFGNITSSLYITDDDVSIEQLLLSLGRSFLEVSGTIEKTGAELLSLTGKTEIHGEDLNLTSLPSGRLQGSGTLSGSLNEPKGQMELSSESTSPITLDIGETHFTPTTVTAKGTLEKLDSGETRFLLDPLSISSPTGSITTRDGITLQNGQLSGVLRMRFDSVQFGDTTLLGGNLTITFQGEQPIQIQSRLQSIEFQELRSPPVTVDAQIADETIKLSLSHRSAENGRLSITGAIESYATAPQLSDLLVEMVDFNVSPAPKTDRWGQLTLSAKGSFSGPLDNLKQLSGEMSLRVSGAVFRGESALNGVLQLNGGKATARLENENESISLNLTLPMTTGAISDSSLAHLSVRLSDFQPEDYFPELQCLLIDLSGDYQFLLSEPLQGSGDMLLSKLNIGCQPYETTLTAPRRGHIEGGQIDFSPLTFRSADSHIDIAGNFGMNSVELSATGSIFLQTFLPLTPFLDDLTGTLRLEAKATGTPTDIQLSGTASIQDGGFAAESVDILAKGFQGDLLLSPEGIRIDSIFGELNGGRTVIRGDIDQKNLLNSNIHAEFEQITFNPSIDVYAGLSGKLSFSHSELGNPQLMGEINIDGGEIIQEFDVRDILSKIPLAIVGRTTGTETSARAPLPDIDMNIDIHSEGNLFVITSFFGIEAAGDVQVRGNLNQPLLRGGITTRRGWLGFNEVRFDIVSGAIEFKPPSIIPTLSIV